METKDHPAQQYVLGNQPEELARLDNQANAIEKPTRLLLQAAGIRPGMRVLDLGTGLGHVARLAGEIVGPAGSVVGIDQSSDALAIARERTMTFGVQAYLSPRDPAGAAILAGVVRSMAPAIIRNGIATEEQLGLDTFEQRLREAVQEQRAVVLLPTVAGAWGHAPDA